MNIEIGDIVKCNNPGSWVDGREMKVLKKKVTGPDQVTGMLLQCEGLGITVVEPEYLELVRKGTP